MDKIALASSLDGQDHLTVWDDLFSLRFASLELEKILIMMVDTCDSKALPFLAQQFDLLGVKGWNQAKTDQDRRDLVKRAIELKRYLGTDYAIKRAVQSVGYYDAAVIKAPTIMYDGHFHHDGTVTYGAGSWATIAVILDIGERKGISPSETNEAIDLINEYKNGRTLLLWIDYFCTLIDTVSETEEVSIQANFAQQDNFTGLNDYMLETFRAADLIDSLGTLDDFGITIKFVDTNGVIIATETF